MARPDLARSSATPAPPPPALATCSLCGTAFDASGQGCRPTCPLARGCAVVCCPSCGYGFPQERGLALRLRRLVDGIEARFGARRTAP